MRRKIAKIKVLYTNIDGFDIINTIYINKDWFDNHKFLNLTFGKLIELVRKYFFGYDIKEKMLDLINNFIYHYNDKKFTDFTIEYIKMN